MNPWSNPRRWERGPIRDRIDDAKTRFAWWLLAKWLGFAAGGVAFVIPWLVITHRALRKLNNRDNLVKQGNMKRRTTKKRAKRRARTTQG